MHPAHRLPQPHPLLRGGAPGPEGSVSKLSWSQLYQRSRSLGAEVLGPYSQIVAGRRGPPTRASGSSSACSRAASAIPAGTSEIQRNILGERVLGLPKD